jgi:hypothetical protein
MVANIYATFELRKFIFNFYRYNYRRGVLANTKRISAK